MRLAVRADDRGYVFAAAGVGESTTDLAWDGQAMIYENGEQLAESERFADEEQLILADLNLDRIVSDRSTTSSFGDSVHDHRRALARFRTVEFELGLGGGSTPAVPLRREIERFPYVPADPASRSERCEEVYSIQVQGLETRLRATGIDKVVIGVSGGLDSTHALIVAVRALDRLRLPRANVLAYTMPGFATSQLTLSNARKLMDGARSHRLGARHPARRHPDASRPRSPRRRGRAAVRRHLRERPGRRAYLAPVPSGEPSTARWSSAPAT